MPSSLSRILIVEDERSHALLMQRAFEKSPQNYDVVITSTLAAAFEDIKSVVPDLVLVDLCLPDGRGLQLLENPEIDVTFPVVVMTSYGNEETAVESLKSGASDYIVKTEHMIPELPRIAERVLAQWKLKSEKQAAEIALRDSERRYRALIENSPVCIIVHCNNVIFLANDEAISCLGGKSAEYVIGRNLTDFVAEESIEKYDEHLFQSSNKIQSSSSTEQVFQKLDGTRIDVELVSTAIDFHGKVGYQSVFQDITKRKQSEIALRTHDRAMAAANNGIFIVELSGNQPEVIYCNKAFTQITGYEFELIKDQAFDFWKCDIQDKAKLEALKSSMISGVNASTLLRVVKEGSTVSYCNITSSPVSDDEGTLTHAVGIVNDLTKQVEAQEQMRQKNAQLAHVARLSTLGEIVAGIAHEVNQPLYAILNYAGTCSNLLETGEESKLDNISLCISRIVEQSTRAGEIIRRLRNYSRRSESEFEFIDLGELIKDVLEILSPVLYSQEITVKSDLDLNLPDVYVDAIQIEQVLTNLVTNACDAVKDSLIKEIKIHASHIENDQIEVRVIDQGRGLPEEIDCFEAFNTTKEGGMGMGLAISRTIVELHGGKIWASPHISQGTTIHFTLPTQPEDTDGQAFAANSLYHR